MKTFESDFIPESNALNSNRLLRISRWVAWRSLLKQSETGVQRWVKGWKTSCRIWNMFDGSSDESDELVLFCRWMRDLNLHGAWKSSIILKCEAPLFLRKMNSSRAIHRSSLAASDMQNCLLLWMQISWNKWVDSFFNSRRLFEDYKWIFRENFSVLHRVNASPPQQGHDFGLKF